MLETANFRGSHHREGSDMVNFYRQGDVGFITVTDELVIAVVEVDGKKLTKRLIRRGEHGHSHVIDKVTDAVLVEHEKVMYVLTKSGVAIKHEEHGTVNLPAGLHEVRIQKEQRGAQGWGYIAD
jgi:hypothetical protein